MSKLLVFVFVLLESAAQALPIKTPQHVFNSIEDITGNKGYYPFPTDMTFRAYADHSIDKMTEYFDPDLVQKGDSIYLCDWYISWFFKYVHPNIKYPYILISNDSDGLHPELGILDFDEKNGWPPDRAAIRSLLYDPKVAAWFCKNCLVSRHPKIFPIPIGPSIIYWGDFDRVFPYLLNVSKQRNDQKSILLHATMTVRDDLVRQALVKRFSQEPYAFVELCDRSRYLETMAASKFVLTPPGLGPDTVRFWESIYLNCIPIVKHSDLDDLYKDLPVLFIDDWDEINESFLNRKYEEICAQNIDRKKAYFDYWQNQINTCQEKVRLDQNDFSYIEATQFPSCTLQNIKKVIIRYAQQKRNNLVYKGAILGLRPYQVINEMPLFDIVNIQDPWGSWGDEVPGKFLNPYSKNSLLKLGSRMRAISYWDNPYTSISAREALLKRCFVFLDLTYKRYEIATQLQEAYKSFSRNIVIMGNLYNDPYIKRILCNTANDLGVEVRSEGDIWYVLKDVK